MMNDSEFKLLDKGNNSEIFLYGKDLVLKMVDVGNVKQVGHLRNEFELMRGLSHPNVLRCHKFKEGIPIRGCKRNILVLDYADGGSLLNFIQKRKPAMQVRLSLVGQLFSAVRYLHVNQMIAHRDLKLDNILIRIHNGKPHLLVSDFGFALRGTKPSTDFRANSYKGTKRGFMAPELHLLLEQPKPYNPFKTDIFSLGVVIFSILFNKLPFEYSQASDKNYSLLISKEFDQFWAKHKIFQETHPQIPMLLELKQMLESMFHVDPEQRPDIEGVWAMEWLVNVQNITE